MAAAEDQGAGPIERVDEGDEVCVGHGPQDRQPDQQADEGTDRGDGDARRCAARRRGVTDRWVDKAWDEEADQAAEDDHGHLTERRRPQHHDPRGAERQEPPGPVRSKGPCHRPDGDRDHRNGRQLEPVDQASRHHVAASGDQAEDHEDRRRRNGEARPGQESARHPATASADRHAQLTARRPGQHLADRHQLREGCLVQPPTPDDELRAHVADMRHRPTECREPEAQEGHQDLASSAHPRMLAQQVGSGINEGLTGEKGPLMRSTDG